MEHAVVMVQKLTDAEMEKLCCRHDFIKQEVPEEDVVQAEPKSGSHLEAIYIKQETPDAELEAITVKEEPIDWNQEPQASAGPAFHSVSFKREIDDVASEASSGLAEAKEKLREGSCGAYNKSTVHQGPAGASQGSVDSVSSDVSCSGSGAEATPPDKLVSQPLLCEHCGYSTGRRDLMKLHLRVSHKLGKSNIIKPNESALQRSRVFKGELYENRLSNAVNLKPRLYCKRKITTEARKHEALLFKCEVCDHSCAHENGIQRHQVSKHGIGQLFRCDFCNYSTGRKDCFKTHQASKHGGGLSLKCELCDFSSAYKKSIKLHQASKHGIGQLFNCELCDYSSGSRQNFNIHLSNKHGIGQRFKCELCDYSSGHKYNFKLHQASKHGEGQLFKCELCDYSSGHKYNFKLHQASKHGKGQLFKCELCDYSSGSRQYFNIHLSNKHGIGQRFKCELCDYSSGHKYSFKFHQASKHGIGQRFKCELCDYFSARKDYLKLHLAKKHENMNCVIIPVSEDRF